MTGRSAVVLMKRAQTLAAKGDDSMLDLAETLTDLRSLAEAARRRSADPRRTCQPHQPEPPRDLLPAQGVAGVRRPWHTARAIG